MSDTHLGYREGRGVINKWALLNYSKPYEQEIYDTFLKVMEDISNIKNVDFLIHSGDMFNIPNIYTSYPPPEPARRIFERGLNLFFEKTHNQIPFIYIEGNHGVFRAYEYTPLESHINKEKYPNFYYYKERDLLNAIKNNKPLTIEFEAKKTRFYLFPYFDFKSIGIYKDAYDNWIDLQRPRNDDDYVNIAIAHGSESDGTLQRKILYNEFNYDYIALGHEHGFKQISPKCYNPGGLLPLNFKERYETQSYLVVEIDEKTKEITNLEKINTDKILTRTFEIIEINVSPQDSIIDLENRINQELNKQKSKEGFNPKTSARLKLNFIGEMTFEKTWQINDVMTKIRRDIFSQSDQYNILQLIWKVSDISETIEDDISPGVIEDYILERPEEEFKNFVEEKLSEDKTQFNVEKLTHFGMNALNNALKIMDKKREV